MQWCINTECSRYHKETKFKGGCEECMKPLEEVKHEPTFEQKLSLFEAMGFTFAAHMIREGMLSREVAEKSLTNFHQMVQRAINGDSSASETLQWYKDTFSDNRITA